MNRHIAALGGDWRGLLELHREKGGEFNSVNWATLASRLGRVGGREVGVMKGDERVSGVCAGCRR